MAEELAIELEPSAVGLADRAGLIRDEKAELVGQMAGAMANHINNVMMSITSYAELELKKANAGQKRNLEQILNNSARATALIQRLLALSGKQSPSPRRISVNPVVNEVAGLLPVLLGEDAKVTLHLDSEEGCIVADPSEVEQLVLTLAMNARNVLTSGGELQISTNFVDARSLPSSIAPAKADSRYLELTLHSTHSVHAAKGSGNNDLRVAHAIAATRSVLRERHGHLRVSSRPGMSTTFRVYLPAVAHELATAKNEVTVAVPASMKTILIVEDDDAVRNPAAEFLKMEGFKVLQARTGPEALRIVKESRSNLDLLITDIVMAGMHGNQVAEELHKSHPELKVLFMSGDAAEAAKASKNPLGQSENVLQKPFRLNKFIDKIHQMLGD